MLDAEEALRAQVEQVAALRRELPLGGGVKEDYVFEENGREGNVQQVRLSELFDDGRQSLLVYGFMFGPKMEKACPMCTSFLDSLDGAAPHISQNMSLAVSAHSPIDRINEFATNRGWKNLRMISSANTSFQYDYLAEGKDEDQWPMANIFTRRNGKIHHYWGSELMFRPCPSGDSRDVDVIGPLWNVLDLTPEGRGEDWYPALSYAR